MTKPTDFAILNILYNVLNSKPETALNGEQKRVFHDLVNNLPKGSRTFSEKEMTDFACYYYDQRHTRKFEECELEKLLNEFNSLPKI